MPFCQDRCGGNVNILAFQGISTTCTLCTPAEGFCIKCAALVINYKEDAFAESHLQIYLTYRIQHMHSPCSGLSRGGDEKQRRKIWGRRKRRQGLIWQVADKPQDNVWKSMSSQRAVLKSKRSQNQSHRSSICQFGNCFCMVWAVAGLSRHWFSIKAKHHIIIYWIEQIPSNGEYIWIVRMPHKQRIKSGALLVVWLFNPLGSFSLLLPWHKCLFHVHI